MRADDWALPYPSTRQPVCGDDVVATSQPLAVSAGLRAFELGGNAVDAALAAALALTVVEPTSNGIGGDLFALVAEPDGTVRGLNASGRAPCGLDVDRLRAAPAMPRLGWDAVTVPGAPSGWGALAHDGARLPLATLAEPAVRLAREGFPVSPVTATAWARAQQRFADWPAFAATFLPGGRAPRAGERIALPDHAATLEQLAATHGDALYRGALGEQLVAHARATGGALREQDLTAHTPEWVSTLTRDAGGSRIHELPPNGQGVAALIALGILERTDVADRDPDDPAALHWQIEATKHALADARTEVADPDRMRVQPWALLARERLDARAAALRTDHASDPGHGHADLGGTVFLVAADREGRAVSLIQSNYEGFGSGVVVPGTGIALHNRGAGFVTDASHPNVVTPGARPFHTIIPALATDHADVPRAAFGVMGGPMQAQGHVQLVCRSTLAGQGPQAAIDAPRWRVDAGREVALEPGVPAATRRDLARRGHRVTVAEPAGFGGAQAAVALPHGGWAAASDPRKDGQAAGR